MTPDEEVVEMIEQAIEAAVKYHPEQAATWTPTIRQQTVRYALWRHHKNRDIYTWVMGGAR
jgi:Golgi nucleoside diphosphatase